MKKSIFISLTLMVFTLISCSTDDDYIGSGNIVSENRNVDTFTKVSSEGTFIINIHQGATQSVEVTADDNIIDNIKTTILNNELSVYLSDGRYSDVTLEVNIIMPNLNGLNNSGSGSVVVSEMIDQSNIDIKNLGSGNITIDGNGVNMIIRNDGTGEIIANQFMTENCDIEINGTGDCRVYCTDSLNVEINGTGDVYYKGNPTIDANISGTGRIINSN